MTVGGWACAKTLGVLESGGWAYRTHHPVRPHICYLSTPITFQLDINLCPLSSCSYPGQSDLAMRLARRVPKSPEDFEQALQLAEQR